MKRKPLLAVVIVVLSTLSARAFFGNRTGDDAQLVTAAVTRGDIVSVISASGTVEAVTTVDVGSQVSGTIEALRADFNDIVREGEVLAKLDQSTFAGSLEESQATLAGAEADAERLRVAQNATEATLARARELSAKQLIPATDLQSAEVESRSAAAQVTGADARVVQARASVKQAQVNLAKTIIRSPIDGVVIARNVDLGQTVAASLQAPTLFTIAADLSEMRLNASIDESDVGQIETGQTVTFKVDAYPSEAFTGVVEQVRLNPVVTQNVVTYAAMVAAPNPLLKLKPGMTANLTIEVARKANVLRVPAAALRFIPTDEVIARFGAKRPDASPRSGVATVWRTTGTTLEAVQVRTGASDGSLTELIDAPLPEGSLVVTQLKGVAAKTTTPTKTSNPLLSGGGPPR